MTLTEGMIDDSHFQTAVENAIDTSYPLIINFWITLLDSGLDFLKNDVLDEGKNNGLDEVDLESLFELSASYLFTTRDRSFLPPSKDSSVSGRESLYWKKTDFDIVVIRYRRKNKAFLSKI